MDCLVNVVIRLLWLLGYLLGVLQVREILLSHPALSVVVARLLWLLGYLHGVLQVR